MSKPSSSLSFPSSGRSPLPLAAAPTAFANQQPSSTQHQHLSATVPGPRQTQPLARLYGPQGQLLQHHYPRQLATPPPSELIPSLPSPPRTAQTPRAAGSPLLPLIPSTAHASTSAISTATGSTVSWMLSPISSLGHAVAPPALPPPSSGDTASSFSSMPTAVRAIAAARTTTPSNSQQQTQVQQQFLALHLRLPFPLSSNSSPTGTDGGAGRLFPRVPRDHRQQEQQQERLSRQEERELMSPDSTRSSALSGSAVATAITPGSLTSASFFVEGMPSLTSPDAPWLAAVRQNPSPARSGGPPSPSNETLPVGTQQQQAPGGVTQQWRQMERVRRCSPPPKVTAMVKAKPTAASHKEDKTASLLLSDTEAQMLSTSSAEAQGGHESVPVTSPTMITPSPHLPLTPRFVSDVDIFSSSIAAPVADLLELMATSVNDPIVTKETISAAIAAPSASSPAHRTPFRPSPPSPASAVVVASPAAVVNRDGTSNKSSSTVHASGEVTSTMRSLRRFLRQRSVTTAETAGTTSADTTKQSRFTAVETQELEALLTALNGLVEPSSPRVVSPDDHGPRTPSVKATRLSLLSSGIPAPSIHASGPPSTVSSFFFSESGEAGLRNAGTGGSPGVNRYSPRHGSTVDGMRLSFHPSSPGTSVHEGENSSVVHSSGHLNSSGGFNAAVAQEDVVALGELVSASSGSARRESVRKEATEDRYKRALQTVEQTAGNCEVALQRVREYSDSLLILVETWMDLHENNFEDFALAVLQRMLDVNPSFKVFFYATDVPTQSLVVMDMIGRSVVAFTRPVDLMDLMAEVGARHNLYGLHEQHFLALRDAFLDVYKEFVSPETFTSSVDVWRMFFKTTVELAVSGTITERGKMYTALRFKVWTARLKKIFAQLLPRQRNEGLHRLLHTTYEHALKIRRGMHSFREFSDPRTAHRSMEVLLRIAKGVIEADAPPLITYNEHYSLDHLLTRTKLPLDSARIALLKESFLHACETYTLPSAWNDVVRATLDEFWTLYVQTQWATTPEQSATNELPELSPIPVSKEGFCLMFTDIESSTRLWSLGRAPMALSIVHHHSVIRGLIEDFGGYEVKTVGDSFLIATQSVSQALLIAYGIQLELMSGPSAPGFEMVPSTQGKGEAACWRSDALRVRVGVHYCQDATAVYDSVHGRFDYYGPGVNCAARVEAAACGGQVLLSEGAYMQLQEEDEYKTKPANRLYVEQLARFLEAQEARGVTVDEPELDWVRASAPKVPQPRPTRVGARLQRVPSFYAPPIQRFHAEDGLLHTVESLSSVTSIGTHPLKGIPEPVHLYSFLPHVLRGRTFADRFQAEAQLPLDLLASMSMSFDVGSSLGSMLPQEALEFFRAHMGNAGNAGSSTVAPPLPPTSLDGQ